MKKIWVKKLKSFKSATESDIDCYLSMSPAKRLETMQILRGRWFSNSKKVLNMKKEVEKDYEELLRLLNKHKVRFYIVGVFAVAFYSIPRYTKDMDILVEPGYYLT